MQPTSNNLISNNNNVFVTKPSLITASFEGFYKSEEQQIKEQNLPVYLTSRGRSIDENLAKKFLKNQPFGTFFLHPGEGRNQITLSIKFEEVKHFTLPLVKNRFSNNYFLEIEPGVYEELSISQNGLKRKLIDQSIQIPLSSFCKEMGNLFLNPDLLEDGVSIVYLAKEDPKTTLDETIQNSLAFQDCERKDVLKLLEGKEIGTFVICPFFKSIPHAYLLSYVEKTRIANLTFSVILLDNIPHLSVKFGQESVRYEMFCSKFLTTTFNGHARKDTQNDNEMVIDELLAARFQDFSLQESKAFLDQLHQKGLIRFPYKKS